MRGDRGSGEVAQFSEPGRTKKLIAAFHFYQRDPAGWECGECRRSGLEKARACGWLGLKDGRGKVVWAAGSAATTECPKSAIGGESAAWVEMFALGRAAGMGSVIELEARSAEAMAVLAREAERTRDAGTR